MEIYLYLVAATLLFGWLMPQSGRKRKNYIILMAAIHTFVCGFRYQYLTGDLMKYQWGYAHMYQHGWLSEEVVQEGRNTGFFWLEKLIAQLAGNDFQVFLFLLALFGEIVVAVIVYRYSPAPWMSYLVWNCLGFYVFGFSAIKQALAMAVIMLAYIGVAERRVGFYLAMMAIAVAFHTPALIFLPVYWIVNGRVSPKRIGGYLLLGVLVFVFKDQVVTFMQSVYYEEEELLMYSGHLGGRFFLLLLITCCGVLLKGFEEQRFEQLFQLMAIACVLQMLASYDNLFTRLADYYFQFSVLFIPMLFYHSGEQRRPTRLRAMVSFNKRSRAAMALVVSACLIWFYYTTNIGVEIAYATDDYTNFRFMWDVA